MLRMALESELAPGSSKEKEEKIELLDSWMKEIGSKTGYAGSNRKVHTAYTDLWEFFEKEYPNDAQGKFKKGKKGIKYPTLKRNK